MSNRVGVECENVARIQGNYSDQTGNLRSSVGFIVADDGEIVQISGFDKVKDGQTEQRQAMCTQENYWKKTGQGLY